MNLKQHLFFITTLPILRIFEFGSVQTENYPVKPIFHSSLIFFLLEESHVSKQIQDKEKKDCRDSPMVNNWTRPKFSSQHPSWAVHDHLQLQFQGIWSPLCTCKAYAHVCAWANTDTQILNAILIFKKGSGLMLDWLRAKAMSYHVGGSVPGTQGLCSASAADTILGD